jgi:hypothetical protein
MQKAADLSIRGFFEFFDALYRFLAPGIRSSWIPPVPMTAGRQP